MDPQSHFRTLTDRFVHLPNFSATLPNAALLHGFEGDHLIGWCYIDHQNGLSIRVTHLYNETPEGKKITSSPQEAKALILIRASDINLLKVAPLPEADVSALSIAPDPEIVAIYERPELEAARNDPSLDPFRATGFPDDVRSLLIPNDEQLRPEMLWVRLEGPGDNAGTYGGKFIVEPSQNLGVHKGDMAVVGPYEIQGGNLPCSHDGGPRQTGKDKKKGWGFWKK
jgi:hypothetical protein